MKFFCLERSINIAVWFGFDFILFFLQAFGYMRREIRATYNLQTFKDIIYRTIVKKANKQLNL